MTRIRWQMCYQHTIPDCRFCGHHYGDKIRPLYTKEGRADLKRAVFAHMKEKHPEWLLYAPRCDRRRNQ